MIRSAIDYSRSFVLGLADHRSRQLIRTHLRPITAHAQVPKDEALTNAIGYLLRAQTRGSDAGMGSFHLTSGWGASYPETTGYSIPTLLSAGNWSGRDELKDAALCAGEWLLRIQRPDGGWQGGRIGEERPSIVFNTAQVVRGMIALYRHTNDQRFLDAADRAGAWIAEVQERNGTWSKHNFLGVARVYDAYVDAPLLLLHQLTGQPLLKNAAERNLEWIIAQQLDNGWFANCDNTVQHNERPITHTLAYTIDGLLECGELLGANDLILAAERPARELLQRFLELGQLNGRYDRQWHGSEALITTGCAQFAICWHRLFQLRKDEGFRVGHARMVEQLIQIQGTSSVGPPESHGALTGSYPLWGRYEKFAFPNWATKYFADALLCDPPAVKVNPA